MNKQMTADPGAERIDLGPIVQVGIVVRDAEATAQAWAERFQMGSVQMVDWPPADGDLATTAMYRGAPGNFRMRLAFLETGPVQIEFIQPLEGDNIYAEFLETRGEGLHHLLFLVEDPKAMAAELDVPILQSGGSTLNPGALWAYLDTEELLGCIVELKTKPDQHSSSL